MIWNVKQFWFEKATWKKTEKYQKQTHPWRPFNAQIHIFIVNTSTHGNVNLNLEKD